MLNLWSVLAKGGRLVHGVSIPFIVNQGKAYQKRERAQQP